MAENFFNTVVIRRKSSDQRKIVNAPHWFIQRDLDVLEGIMKIRSSQPSHRFDNFTTYTVLLTLMHHDRHPILFWYFLLNFSNIWQKEIRKFVTFKEVKFFAFSLPSSLSRYLWFIGWSCDRPLSWGRLRTLFSENRPTARWVNEKQWGQSFSEVALFTKFIKFHKKVTHLYI